MDVCKLPEAWAASRERLREVAATYPSDHPAHACLMNRIGELDRRTKELEEALAAAGGLLSKSKMSSAIEAVEQGLQSTGRDLPPSKKAALFMAAYEIFEGEKGRSERMEKGPLYLKQSEFNQKVIDVAMVMNGIPLNQAELILAEASDLLKSSVLVDASGERFSEVAQLYRGGAS